MARAWAAERFIRISFDACQQASQRWKKGGDAWVPTRRAVIMVGPFSLGLTIEQSSGAILRRTGSHSQEK
jgi:hypothetical protein